MKSSFFDQYKNELALYRIRKKLLVGIVALLVLFAMLTLALFYLTERSVYRKNMMDSNEIMANQMVSVYELYMQNVREIAHDTVLHNQDLMRLSVEDRQDFRVKTSLLNLLNSVSVMNAYVHSAYLYFEEDGTVYSSLSMPYAIMPLDQFGDAAVFEQEHTAKPYQVAPHLLTDISPLLADVRMPPLVISYVVPVNTRNGMVYLCVNVNTRSLYTMILRDFELEQNRNFYLVDDEGYVVFHRDPNYLFVPQSALPVQENVIVSEAHSDILGFTFVFESTIVPYESNLLAFVLWIMGALGAALVVAIALVLYSTLPIRRMVQIAKKSSLREFLAKSEGSADAAFWDKSMQECKNHVVSVFRIASLHDAEDFLNQSIKKMSAESEQEYQFLTIKMSAETVAIIFGNIRHYGDVQFRQHVRAQCEKICAASRAGEKVTCVISSVKKGVEELRGGYRECCDTFCYRYLFPQQVIMQEEIDRTLPAYPFPVRHERHIINNLMAGKREACLRHVDEIFEEFRSGAYLISDSEIDHDLAVMAGNISLRMDALSAQTEPMRHDYSACETLDEAEKAFVQEICLLLDQVANRPGKTANSPNAAVMEYIDNNFCRNDICANVAAQELSVAVSVVNRTVKEATQRSFSEYITYRRIQRSKELLAEGSMSINAVSEAVGFTYPYYFIRKFKEQEGVTPGQYAGAQTPQE